MLKVCFVENNRIVKDYFSKIFGKDFNLSFFSLEQFESKLGFIFSKHNKIVVDISRYGDYINFCNVVLNKYLENRKLALILNEKQKRDILESGIKVNSMIAPESHKDLGLFLSI